MANRRNRTRTPSEMIVSYLGGLAFPCGKDEILSQALGQGAPPEVVDLLDTLPDEAYNSMDDITRHYRTWVKPSKEDEG